MNEKDTTQFCGFGTCGSFNKHTNYKLRHTGFYYNKGKVIN